MRFAVRLVPYALVVLSFPSLGNSPRALASEQILLRVANWAGAEELELERRIVRRFMERYPQVRVEVETIPASNYKEKILTAIAAGSAPDVFLLDSVILPSFLNRNLLVDLMPYARRLGVDLGMYFPNVLAIAMRDSHLYAFPKDFTPLVMYFNKDLFDRAGVPYPQEGWTWDDYLELARRLTIDVDGDGRIDQFGTAFTNYLLYWQPWVWMNGGDVLSPDGRHASGYFDSEPTKQALQFLIDLRVKYGVAPHGQYLTATGSPGTLFFTGRIGMIPSGHWLMTTMLKYLRQGRLRIGAVHLPVPKGGRRVTVMYESGWCVPRTARHPEWAARLAAFLGGKEAGRIRVESRIAVPAIRQLAAEQAQLDTLGIEPVFFREVQYARQPWGTRVEEFRRIEELARDAVDMVMIRGWDIDRTFAEYARRMDQELTRFANLASHEDPTRGKRDVLRFLLWCLAAAGVVIAGTFLIVGRKARRDLAQGYAFLFPSFLHLFVIVLVPLVFSLYLSFHEWNVILAEKPFVGLRNYRDLLHDSLFLNALKNTAMFSLQVPIGMALALAVALALNRPFRGVTVLRTLFFLPSVTSFVAIAMVWQWLYQPQFGLFNYLLDLLGLPRLPWLTSPATALPSIMVMTIWMSIGYQMVIFLAGLQGIPAYLYEAAIVDGANAWQRFWHITLPLLKPTTFFVLVTAVIGSFQVFTSVYVMTAGGPARATDVVVYHIYQNAWEYLRMGYASAMAWVLFLIVMVATYVQFRLVGRGVEYGH